jgi:hypothetical protein
VTSPDRKDEAMGTMQTMRSAATGHGRGRPLLLVVLAFLACFAAAGTPATAGPPVEHSGKATFVDPTFSEFLTQSCGFAVTVTDTESDTLLDNGTVFMLSIHITADVVGNGHRIMLSTNNPVIVNDRNNLAVGMIVQVRSATNQLLVQYGGQLRTLDDGTSVFHPAFPQFDLCDYLR